MQIEQAMPVQGAEDQAPRDIRDLTGLLVLAVGGGLTVAWIGFLGWGALSLAAYVFS